MENHERKHHRPFLALFLALFSLACFSTDVRATVVIPPDFATLVSRAEVIFRGQVTGERSEWTGSGPSRAIVTYVTFQVLETLKGAPPSTYTLRFLGGTVNGQTLEVDGAPTFALGEKNLLFVVHNGSQFVPLVGIMHGYFRLETDPATGAEMVIKNDGAPLRSVAEIDREHQAAVAPDSVKDDQLISSGTSMKTSDFETEIRKQLASSGK